MAESDRDEPARRLRSEPQVLANIPPSIGQRRAARILVLALLAILAATWPFATVKLPEIDAFVPSLAAALFVSDCVTAVLLFGQFSILRQWALLVIANGYVFSALIVVAHALAFPGAFSHSGLFGSGLQSAVWLYWFWHCRTAARHHRVCAAQEYGSCDQCPLNVDLPSARASQPRSPLWSGCSGLSPSIMTSCQ